MTLGPVTKLDVILSAVRHSCMAAAVDFLSTTALVAVDSLILTILSLRNHSTVIYTVVSLVIAFHDTLFSYFSFSGHTLTILFFLPTTIWTMCASGD
jgi:hypothetical protein